MHFLIDVINLMFKRSNAITNNFKTNKQDGVPALKKNVRSKFWVSTSGD